MFTNNLDINHKNHTLVGSRKRLGACATLVIKELHNRAGACPNTHGPQHSAPVAIPSLQGQPHMEYITVCQPRAMVRNNVKLQQLRISTGPAKALGPRSAGGGQMEGHVRACPPIIAPAYCQVRAGQFLCLPVAHAPGEQSRAFPSLTHLFGHLPLAALAIPQRGGGEIGSSSTAGPGR